MLAMSGINVTSLMLVDHNTGKPRSYGISMTDLVFMEGSFTITPSFVYNSSEWDIISRAVDSLPPMALLSIGKSNQSTSTVTTLLDVGNTSRMNATYDEPACMVVPRFVSYRLNHVTKFTDDIRSALTTLVNTRDSGYFGVKVTLYDLHGIQTVDIKITK
jgi:hypothetical protein